MSFNDKTGTIFEHSKLLLSAWFSWFLPGPALTEHVNHCQGIALPLSDRPSHRVVGEGAGGGPGRWAHFERHKFKEVAWMEKSSLEIQDNTLLLDRGILQEASLEGMVTVIVRDSTIIVKPASLTEKMRGLVERKLSYRELDEIYAKR